MQVEWVVYVLIPGHDYFELSTISSCQVSACADKEVFGQNVRGVRYSRGLVLSLRNLWRRRGKSTKRVTTSP